MIRFRRPEPIPTLFFLAAFLTLLALGGWQLSRLHWKQQMMAQVEEAQQKPALATLPQNLDGFVYRRVQLIGRFRYEHTIHLIGRQQGQSVGYYMVTPFEMEYDGRIILVNRGFSPPGEAKEPMGLVKISGILREPRTRREMAPDNVPDKNIWTYEDMDKIGEMIGRKPLPLVVEATGEAKPGEYPIPGDGKVIFRNDHLGYALTWFALAATSVVMFGAYYRKKA